MAALPEFPLLKRELIALLRTRKAFWLLVVTVPFAGLLPLLAWPRDMRAARSAETLATFLAFFLSQLTLALVSVPALTAGAFAGERERETYDLLHMTLLPPSSIVLSKALASVGYLAVLLLATAPCAAVLHLLGSVRYPTILACYAVTFAAVATATLICLSQSMRSRRTAHAAVRGVIAVAFWNGGLFLLLLLLQGVIWASFGYSRPPFFDPGELAPVLSPHFTVLCEILGRNLGRAMGLVRGEGLFWVQFLAYASLLGTVYLAFLLVRVRKPEGGPAAWLERRSARRAKSDRRGSIRRPLSARFLLTLGEKAALFKNPVFLKEVRSEFFGRPWFRRIVFWSSAAIFAGLAYAPQEVEPALFLNFLACLVLVALIIPGVVATGFPREADQGNLDSLRGSLLSLPQVMSGKFMGGIYSCIGIPLAGALASGVAVLAYGEPRYSHLPPSGLWLLGVAVIASVVLFTSALSTLASVLARRSMAALLIAYVATVGIYLVYPFVTILILSLWNISPDDPLGLAFGAFHPVWALASIEFKSRGLGALPAFLCIYLGGTVVLWLLSAWRLHRRWAIDD